MSKYLGSIEELIDVDAKSDDTLESWEQNEESEYWIHRTSISSSLYFNTNFQRNDCPLIISEQEAEQYIKDGKEIKGIIQINEFYNDAEQKLKVINKLQESGLSLEDFESQLRDKVSSTFKSFFEIGLYMPDVYGGNLERTAHQYSPEKIRKIINAENFGFNNYRGGWDAAIILEIPVEDQSKVLEELPEPIESGSEYYGLVKISQVVSPKYIKGLVVKFGNQTIFIKNDKFISKEKIENSQTFETAEAELFLYQTEQLFDSALQEYFSSELPSIEKTKQYISRVALIEKAFRKYAVKTTGFIGTERYKKVQDFIKTFPRFLPYVYDETKGDFINQQNEKNYYMQIASQLDTLGTPTSSKKM